MRRISVGKGSDLLFDLLSCSRLFHKRQLLSHWMLFKLHTGRDEVLFYQKRCTDDCAVDIDGTLEIRRSSGVNVVSCPWIMYQKHRCFGLHKELRISHNDVDKIQQQNWCKNNSILYDSKHCSKIDWNVVPQRAALSVVLWLSYQAHYGNCVTIKHKRQSHDSGVSVCTFIVCKIC